MFRLKSLRTIKSIIPVLAFLMIMFAFKTQKKEKAEAVNYATGWFKFMGTDPTNLTQVQDNTKYEYVDGQPCTGGDLICSVKYTGTLTLGQHPASFSPSFKQRIADVVNGVTPGDEDISLEE